MSRRCINDNNVFCYVCGKFTLKSQRRTITPTIKMCYKLYFGCAIGDQDKSWAPHICCSTCAVDLRSWLKGKKYSMPFAVPMIWREPRDHVTDCYFCLTNIIGHTSKTKKTIVYPNLPSALRPVPHSVDLPVPEKPDNYELNISDESDTENAVMDSEVAPQDTEYIPPNSNAIHKMTQCELNDLIRDLELPKRKAELLASRMQQYNYLEKDVKISIYRYREKELVQFFSTSDSVCYCNNIDGLFSVLGHDHKPEEWCLFIDSSKVSLKVVLLHIFCDLPSIPIGYSTCMKESYENLKILLDFVQYSKYSWKVCGDFKVIALLLGMQTGYTKFCCYLCEWDSRAIYDHYVVKDWPRREYYRLGEKNVAHQPLVEPQNIILPLLHIKLGVMKNFVKAMDQNSEAFKYIGRKFPGISSMKLKEGIFIGPQVRELMHDMTFYELLEGTEKFAWEAFCVVAENFLGRKKDPNYKEMVQNLIDAYRMMGCNMSLKIHFLNSHIDCFHSNSGHVGDEHGERFHQDLATIEKRYKGKWTPSMLADFCWFLKRETKQDHNRSASCSKWFH